MEFSPQRGRPPAASPRRGQDNRRHDEGPRDRAGDGLRAGRRRRVLSGRGVVAAVPDGGPLAHAGDCRVAGRRRLVLPGPRDARGIHRGEEFSHPRPVDLQRRGRLRRFFRDRPAVGRPGVCHRVVGDAAPASPGGGRRGRRSAVRLSRPGGPSGAGRGRTAADRQRPGPARRPAARRRPAGRGDRAGEPVPPPLGRAARPRLRRGGVPAARIGDVDRRDAGDSLLLGPGRRPRP